jgi:vitamin B12/bleomycin/antimicrobial peptide transport system ATP-binding/permease protein
MTISNLGGRALASVRKCWTTAVKAFHSIRQRCVAGIKNIRNWLTSTVAAVHSFFQRCVKGIKNIRNWPANTVAAARSLRQRCLDGINNIRNLPWKPLWQMNRMFWFSKKNRKAWYLAAQVVVLTISSIELGVVLVSFPAHLAQAYEHFNFYDILYWALLGSLLALVQQLCNAFYNSQKVLLNLTWRQWFSGSLIVDWYDENGKPYYWIVENEELKKKIPNPDYVFTQDPDSLPNIWMDLVLSLGETLLKFFSYGLLLLGMSYLLSGAAVFAALTNYIVVVWLGKRLFKLSDDAFNAEAALKISAGRSRTEGGAIAFANGEEVAKQNTLNQLAHTVETWDEIRRVNRRIQIFSGGWNSIMPYAPYLIMLFVFGDHIFFGYVLSATAAFQAFYAAANALPDRFGNIANLGKVLDRLSTLMEAIKWCGKDPDPANHIQVLGSDKLGFDKVTILTPDGKKVLWKELTLTLNPGTSLLMIAPHIEAQGMTSLLKTVKGLFNKGSGTLYRPSSEQIMYLTQTLDLSPGSLREVLSHPKTELIQDNDLLMRVLAQVNLSQLVTRANDLDTARNWKELGKGEQERLVLARILLRQPKYVLIESAGLDESEERIIYMALHLTKATVLTAGVPSRLLLSFHDSILELLPDGNWKGPYPVSAYKDPELAATKDSSA